MTDLAPTDPYPTPTRVDLDAVPLAVVKHAGVRLGDIEELFDADYSTLNAAAAAGRIRLVGPALAIYHGDPAGVFDIEVGMPVEAPIERSEGGLVGSVLPAGTAMALTHTGSYSGLGACWNTLARAAGAAPTGDWAEVYVTEPGLTPVERLRTDCLLYVED